MSPDSTEVLPTSSIPHLSSGEIWLDTSIAPNNLGSRKVFKHPQRILQAFRVADIPSVLMQMEQALDDGWHVAGYWAYEAGEAFEPLHDTDPNATCTQPLVWLGVYATPEIMPLPEPDARHVAVRNLRFDPHETDYLNAISQIRQHIFEGDVYQINYTGRFRFDFDGDPVALYESLRQRQPVAYGACLATGQETILSLSPELFFAIEAGEIRTRPMKGTAPRGKTTQEDALQATQLANDPKNRAENLMIVDLLRNDLSRICETGRVDVPALFQTERYRSLWQMTSEVTGKLRTGTRPAEVFRALFPCGSVTGAPKLRARSLIKRLETEPRGVYCGAIGYWQPDGKAMFSVAIRTIRLAKGHGILGVGSGVVWDSKPIEEYQESLLKAQFLTRSQPRFQLIETMRLENGQVAWLPLHRARLSDSAAYFGFRFEAAVFEEKLAAVFRTLPSVGIYRIRVLLHENGQIDCTAHPFVQNVPDVLRVCFAEQSTAPDDPFLYHKTTLRTRYDEALQAAETAGFHEVLWCNTRGEITEGSRTNLFIVQNGLWKTPPVSSGLLRGVLRQHLLKTLPHIREEVITPDVLAHADAVYVGNALRGLMRAEIVPR